MAGKRPTRRRPDDDFRRCLAWKRENNKDNCPPSPARHRKRSCITWDQLVAYNCRDRGSTATLSLFSTGSGFPVTPHGGEILRFRGRQEPHRDRFTIASVLDTEMRTPRMHAKWRFLIASDEPPLDFRWIPRTIAPGRPTNRHRRKRHFGIAICNP